MAKITRYNGNLKSFGADSTSTNRTVFGDTSQSDTLDDNLNTEFFEGWEIVGTNDAPPKNWFNAVGYTLGQLLAYIHQIGVPEWNAAQEYAIGSSATFDGDVYICRTATHVSASDPSGDATNWKRSLNVLDLVNTALTGNPTAPTQTAGNNSTRLATTAFAKAKSESDSIGLSQSWVDVRGSRSLAVTYTNTTGKPIFVNVSASGNAFANIFLDIDVDGIELQNSAMSLDNDGDARNTVCAIVPDGSSYIVSSSSGSAALTIWTELR